MRFPPQFTTKGDVPGLSWQIVKAMLDAIILRYAEPPYSILFATEAFEAPLWDLPGGTNVFIINLPFFLDCPSKSDARQEMLVALQKAFPYMGIGYIDGDGGQYIYGDMNWPPDTVLPPLTD